MKKNIFLVLFLLLGLLPAYTFLGWIYIFNKYPFKTQIEKKLIYDQDLFFGVDLVKSSYFPLLILFIGLCSIIYFLIKLIRETKRDNKKSRSYFVFLGIIILYSFFFLLGAFMSLWFVRIGFKKIALLPPCLHRWNSYRGTLTHVTQKKTSKKILFCGKYAS